MAVIIFVQGGGISAQRLCAVRNSDDMLGTTLKETKAGVLVPVSVFGSWFFKPCAFGCQPSVELHTNIDRTQWHLLSCILGSERLKL